MSVVSHISEVIFELVDKAIKEIGEDEVVIYNASNNMGAKNYCLRNGHAYFGLLAILTHSTLSCKELAAYQGSRRYLNRQKPSPSLSMGI
jgi:hypothetical protein